MTHPAPAVRPAVDVDDSRTWPPALADLVGRLADDVDLAEADRDEYVDLDLDAYEDDVLALLDGHLVRALHCTRLLDYEADAIRAEGLRLLDEDLVNDRLDQARERGLFTDAEHTLLRSGHRLAPGRRVMGSSGEVCLTLSAEATAHHTHGARPLLTNWGGEVVYSPHCDTDPGLAAKLRSLGRPALVTAHLDLAYPGDHKVSKSLVHTFVGKAIGHTPANADVFYRAPVPASHIASIVFPGDLGYDRIPGLPRN
ncbi:hypothetical protein [Kitasatospora paranensis]|uniref:Uncharacterized protein n=1 Tax=Kitasatospora paranensis TaxID=258053 RepID=A0ABW2G386_9ACTN